MSTNTDSVNRPYFPALDGVRALAALMVMAFHFCQNTNRRGIWVAGQTGVDLFFVLSGFLITTILLIAPAEDWREVRKFYIRRTLRIFPLYFGVLITLALLGVVCSFWFWIYLENIPLFLAIPVSGPGHFWSLAVEEQFYVVWPFLVFFLPRKWLVKALWTIIAIAVLFRTLLTPLHLQWPVLVMFIRFDGLAAGGLLAVYRAQGVLQQYRRKLIALGVFAAIAICLEWFGFHGRGEDWNEVVKFSLSACLYAAMIGYLITSTSSPVSRLLSARPLRFIGKISYSLYVFHPFVFAILIPRLSRHSTPVQLLVCMTVTFNASVISWYGYEMWFIRLKGVLAPERNLVAVTASA